MQHNSKVAPILSARPKLHALLVFFYTVIVGPPVGGAVICIPMLLIGLAGSGRGGSLADFANFVGLWLFWSYLLGGITALVTALGLCFKIAFEKPYSLVDALIFAFMGAFITAMTFGVLATDGAVFALSLIVGVFGAPVSAALCFWLGRRIGLF